jgi:amino acid transporter
MTERRRVIGYWDLTLFALAVGYGVRWLAYGAAAGPASLPLWILAMAGFLAPLVAATAELVERFPGEGGIYDWTRETVGPFAGFITGWLYWTCNLPFFSSVLYFALASFTAALGPGAARAMADPWLFGAVACAVAIAIGALHWIGLGAGKWLTNFGSIAVTILTLILLGLGLAVALHGGPATDFVHASYAPPINADGAALWAIMVFAYGGPESLAFLRGDVAGGVRQIVRALIPVSIAIALAYVAGTAAILSILKTADASRLAGLPDAYMIGFAKVGLKSLGWLPPLLLGLMAVGGYSAWFGLAARLPFAIGVDRYFPVAFARRDPKTGAPTTAILVQVIAVVILVILGQAGASVKGAYDFLTSMSVVSYTLPFFFLFLAYLRADGPVPAGAWTAPGGRTGRKTLAWMGLVLTVSGIACTLIPSPDATDKLGATVKLLVATAVLIGLGAAIYAQASRRRTAAA